ncbi:inositol monophosphatase family protein [Archangium primigenium]|uniref:inositol monophosphatase family protein n=1 Tax=[Archangium] primigenium TaxID=2792470 RepID=UPI0019582339|nr:inositol monophosphatase [Archangium primigenium]
MSDTLSNQELLTSMTQAAHALGDTLRTQPRPRGFRTRRELLAAFQAMDGPQQRWLRDRLSALQPEAVWADEMDGELPRTGYVWLSDPMDGAVQFMHGHTHWCVNLTLAKDLEPLATVLYHPALNETYAALRGHGATLNGQPLAPSDKTELSAAYVITSQSAHVAKFPRDVDLAGRSLSAVLGAGAAVRNLGATAWQVADVGGGRIDAFWLYGVDDVNLLGATLIAQEAGARVTDVAGQPWRAGAASIVVAAPSLHAQMLAVLPRG